MKKLALIGMVVAGLLLSTSVALAKPTGMTNAEFQALIMRSEALNSKYGQYEYAQPALVSPKPTTSRADVNQKLEEIGAWAVPSKQTESKPIVSEKLSGLDLPTGTTVASSGRGFDWNDAGIGAVLALAGVLGIGVLLTVRNQQHHRPIPH
jgi:hypothetical protein